ncbi:MAG TPA: group 1 truncated hemoglobin [Verrucomicrobiales bacterium]|nr:group 1 truncated hemoglobin [Verrucomicrobiales bacterium]HIL68323.1 group 1 truncated hemoglobin [Verrucomicrobiota bacterium]
MASLFEKLGGEAVVDATVDKFYGKVLADDRIKHFFENTDMEKQRGHQKKFLTFAFGGAESYNGNGMRAAHAKLVKEMGLNDSHFDAVVELLGGTLTEMGVAEDLVEEVADTAETLRTDILNR